MPMLKTSPRRNLGKVSPALALLLGSVVAAGTVIALMLYDQRAPSGSGSSEPLIVFCAAGVRLPVEAASKEYEAAYGVPIQLNYGGSQTLFSGLKVSRQGDLYIPADDSYVEAARTENLAQEALPLALMRAVVCVRKGNPKNIRVLADLFRTDIRLAQANPDAAAIGKLTRRELRKVNQWDVLEQKTKVFKGTVNEVANAVTLDGVDAGIAWDSVVAQYDDLEAVPLPELKEAKANITITVLESTTQPTAALSFARYLAARDKGLLHFARHGYEPADGDVWEEHPTLNLYSGAMLRPAVEETIRAFEAREGVRVSSKFNGCGILVAAMKTGERPDAYFSCETSFMSQVSDLFLKSDDISRNRLVILVPKGNPRNIKTLVDLGAGGLKLGLAHEEQSALGALTAKALKATGAYDAVRKNVAVESPTGDFLVNQIRTGSLDAVVVYHSNAVLSTNQLDIIPVEGEGTLAVQPVAVGRESAHKQLAERLIDAIKTAQSKERFLSMGFTWEWHDPDAASQ